MSSSAAVEGQDLAGHLLAPPALVVVRLDVAVAPHQLDHRQVGEAAAVRRAAGVEHERPLARDALQLVEEAGLADTGLAHDRDARVPRRAIASGERLLERRELARASDEARQAARSAALEGAAQRADAEQLVEAYRVRSALHARGAERLEVEEAGRERVGPLADDDAAGVGEALHALRQADRMADRDDVGVPSPC